MYWFIKTETFTQETLSLPPEKRNLFLIEHKKWVRELSLLGETIYSGYLVNEKDLPGGGGLLMIKSPSFIEAKKIIKQDPMIKNNLVIWDLKKWIQIS